MTTTDHLLWPVYLTVGPEKMPVVTDTSLVVLQKRSPRFFLLAAMTPAVASGSSNCGTGGSYRESALSKPIQPASRKREAASPS